VEDTAKSQPSISQPDPDPDPDPTDIPHVVSAGSLWGDSPPRPDPDDSPKDSGRAGPPPESQWWPETHPAPPIEEPPRHRGRLVAIALAVLLLAGGGVAAVVVATSGSRQGAVLPTPPTAASTSQPVAGPLIPAAPAAFTAQAKSGGEVDLAWAFAPSSAHLTRYNLYRDAQLINQIAPTLTTYQDFDVAPEKTYSYAIESVSAAGRSVQTTQIVSTPKAPGLAQARVSGGFSINGKYTHENFTNRQEGEKYVSFWFFTPACGGGEACNVKTSGEGEGAKESLKLKEGTYSGEVQIPHGGECGTKKLTETQTITFTVTKAAFSEGVWNATEISGTTRFDLPSSVGCLSAFGIVSFTGTVAS
jgi:hypothetical protein